MPLHRVAFCPQPPVLVPELAGQAAAELDTLRRAADAAVRDLLGRAVDRIVVVGGQDPGRTPGGPRPALGGMPTAYRPPLHASFRPWGVATDVQLTARPQPATAPGGQPPPPGAHPAAEAVGPAARLPLSLTMAAWLLSRNGLDPATTAVEMIEVPAGAAPADCQRWGRELAADGPSALLVMGDGSACRGLSSPGYHDERAEPFDDRIAAALAAADHQALAALPPDLATELQVAGRTTWQLAAAAVAATAADWSGRVDHYAAPYGVAYFVASWHRN
ncbi:hypothetical protein [Micromonospora sp. NBC_01813]|uniref:hypothetical protein n=1 Tax=Micromonospora sp. NBC_01813 TaxID=2975988 RepID=UPI002DDBBB9F|nr:hypothetical protein [Micromonospora sp. NBC_01813]WSA11634.1 hypothetical protein OG958_13105 [Micromonospora sp. NBC_01813]